MTPHGRTLSRIVLALVYALLVLEPQALAVSLKATATPDATSTKLTSPKASAAKELEARPARPAAKPKPLPKATPQPVVKPTAEPTAEPSAAPEAQPSAQPTAPPVIVTELRWDGERLIVGTDRLLRFRSFTLREPDRVVVDLFDAELGDPTMSRILAVQRAPIRQIRVGAHPEDGFLRVVIDSDRPLPVQIAQPRGVPRLVIQPQGLDPAEPESETPVTRLAATSKPEVQGPPERLGPPDSLKATPPQARAEASKATATGKTASAKVAAKEAPAKAQEAKAPASKAPEPKVSDLKAAELTASRSATPRTAREEVGVQISQSGGSTQLKLQGARALRLRIQQEVEPARLVVQIPAGSLKGKLPKARGQVEAIETREDGDLWILEARLPEGPLDIQNRLEDDGKSLVLAIQRQVVSNAKRPLILIDPGHGGDDPGAVGAGGTRESEVNLAIALKLQEALQARGVNAVLTRTGDVSLDLASRARMVDQLGAQALVSVHANSHDVSSALGLETYYRTSISQPFAQQIHQVLVSDLQRPDRGVREARLFVLRHPTIPSALIEAGFISNPEEEGLLADRDYQKKAAEAIAKGITSYLSTPIAELSH